MAAAAAAQAAAVASAAASGAPPPPPPPPPPPAWEDVEEGSATVSGKRYVACFVSFWSTGVQDQGWVSSSPPKHLEVCTKTTFCDFLFTRAPLPDCFPCLEFVTTALVAGHVLFALSCFFCSFP